MKCCSPKLSARLLGVQWTPGRKWMKVSVVNVSNSPQTLHIPAPAVNNIRLLLAAGSVGLINFLMNLDLLCRML